MRKTKAEAAQTRQMILDSALKLFAENGYESTGLTQIAKDCQLTRGAIYWHFKNKADILSALEELYFKPFVERMETILHQENAWHKSAEQLIVFFTDIKNKPAQLQLLRFCEEQKISQDNGIKELFSTYKEIRHRQINQLIDKACENKEIPPNTDKIFAFIQIRSTVQSIVNLYAEPIEGVDIQCYVTRMIRQTFDGISRGSC